MWPSGNGTIDTSMQGTTLVTADDHALNHRQLGSLGNQIGSVFGTTSGTNLLRNTINSGDQLFSLNSGGTANQTITKGTANNMVFGTPTITVGSDATGDTYYRNGGTFNRLPIGSNGQVLTTNGTLPSWTSAPTTNVRMRAYLGTTMGTVANNTEFLITLDTKDYDSGTNFSLSTHRFTAPVTGYYLIAGVTAFSDGQGTTGGRWATEIRKNGTNMQFNINHLSNNNGLAVEVTGVFNLTANDFIELYGYNLIGRDAGAVGGSIYNSLAIHLLSV